MTLAPSPPEALESPINFTQMSQAPSIDLNGYSKWPRYLLFNHFLIKSAISERWAAYLAREREGAREEERRKRTRTSHSLAPRRDATDLWHSRAGHSIINHSQL